MFARPRQTLLVFRLTKCCVRGPVGFSELEDYSYNMNRVRRRTNSVSSTSIQNALKSKFETIDPEAIEYEETLHGPSVEDLHDHPELEKASTSSSDGLGSVNEENELPSNKH